MNCAFCNSTSHTEHRVREMMFGLRERFLYLECQQCGALRMAEPPRNISDYYPDTYYSFSQQRGFKQTLKPFLLGLSRLGIKISLGANRLIRDLNFTRSMRILDVGGGNGQLAKELRAAGFKQALCIDPFGEESAYCQRKNLSETEGGWDRIMFHHSFEHIADQLGTLSEVRKKLAPGGMCLIRIPVAQWAWRQYRVNWVQLDAPRHMCLHTPTSFNLAAQQAGLQLLSIKSDSTAFQFWGSELYRRDIPLIEGQPHLRKHFDAKTMKAFAAEAISLNYSNQGDQAAFILSKDYNRCRV